jgi:hypothetical protein
MKKPVLILVLVLCLASLSYADSFSIFPDFTFRQSLDLVLGGSACLSVLVSTAYLPDVLTNAPRNEWDMAQALSIIAVWIISEVTIGSIGNNGTTISIQGFHIGSL